MEDRDKLKHLIGHWIEHNREHADEFQQWADKAKGFGESEVHDDIMEAVEQLKKVNASLNKASQSLV